MTRKLTFAVFGTCWLVYTLFWSPFILREHFPALALARHGTLDVSEFARYSEDIFRGPAGGAYINNNPGASLAGAVPLAIVRPLLERIDHQPPRPEHFAGAKRVESAFYRAAMEQGRERFFLLTAFLTVAFVMAPAGAFAAAYLVRRLLEGGLPFGRALTVGFVYAFGTPVLFRAGYLNHNQLVGHAGLIAFLLLYRAGGAPVTRQRALCAGLLGGFALLCDFSGVVVVASLGVYILWRCGIGMVVWFAAGVLPGLLGLVAYQVWAFGNPLRPPQHYMAPTTPTVHGYRGFDWPSPALLWANFFDPRFGLFAYSPVLLAAVPALFLRGQYRMARRETVVLYLYFILFVLFCAANQYSWLQPSTGFRYLVPVVPALAVLSMQALQGLPKWAQTLLAATMVAQGVMLAATHTNQPFLAVRHFIERRGSLVSMEFLAAIGFVPSAAWGSLAAYTLTAVLVWAVWRGISPWTTAGSVLELEMQRGVRSGRNSANAGS